MDRRQAIGLLGATTVGSQAEAWALPSTALKGRAAPGPRLGVGRLKQSASRWPYRAIPLPDFCKAAAGMGLAGVALLGPDAGDTVRSDGPVWPRGRRAS